MKAGEKEGRETRDGEEEAEKERSAAVGRDPSNLLHHQGAQYKRIDLSASAVRVFKNHYASE